MARTKAAGGNTTISKRGGKKKQVVSTPVAEKDEYDWDNIFEETTKEINLFSLSTTKPKARSKLKNTTFNKPASAPSKPQPKRAKIPKKSTKNTTKTQTSLLKLNTPKDDSIERWNKENQALDDLQVQTNSSGNSTPNNSQHRTSDPDRLPLRRILSSRKPAATPQNSSPLARVASEPKYLKPSKLADSVDREVKKYKRAGSKVNASAIGTSTTSEKLLKPATKRSSVEDVEQTPLKRIDSDLETPDIVAPPSPQESAVSVASSVASKKSSRQKKVLTSEKSANNTTLATGNNTTLKPPGSTRRAATKSRRNKHDQSAMGRPIWKNPTGLGVKANVSTANLPNSSRLSMAGNNTTLVMKRPVFTKTQRTSTSTQISSRKDSSRPVRRKILGTPSEPIDPTYTDSVFGDTVMGASNATVTAVERTKLSRSRPPRVKPFIPPSSTTEVMSSTIRTGLGDATNDPFDMDFSVIQNPFEKTATTARKSLVHPAIARLNPTVLATPGFAPLKSSTPVMNRGTTSRLQPASSTPDPAIAANPENGKSSGNEYNTPPNQPVKKLVLAPETAPPSQSTPIKKSASLKKSRKTRSPGSGARSSFCEPLNATPPVVAVGEEVVTTVSKPALVELPGSTLRRTNSSESGVFRVRSKSAEDKVDASVLKLSAPKPTPPRQPVGHMPPSPNLSYISDRPRRSTANMSMRRSSRLNMTPKSSSSSRLQTPRSTRSRTKTPSTTATPKPQKPFQSPAPLAPNTTNIAIGTTPSLSILESSMFPEGPEDLNVTRTRSRTKRANGMSAKHAAMHRLSTTSSIASRVDGKIDINDPLHRILAKCSSDSVVSLSSLFPRGSKITKLGEGVYGEVYSHNGYAVKVQPVNGNVVINETEQMTIKQVLPEIAITRLLSDLSENLPYYYTKTFVKLLRVNIAQGVYPKVLDDAWLAFEKERGSENDRPASKLKSNQMYLVQVLSNGGIALEDYKLKTVDEAFSIFHQVALGLAVSESRYEFEHRDLHIGNILIRPFERDTLHFELRGDTIDLRVHGVQATIIDFSLSRAIHNDEFTLQPWVLFQDLDKDEDIFKGQGDIQFEVYRDMEKYFTKGIPNRWRDFRAKTNVLWLEYLHAKLLKMLPKKCKGRRKFQNWKQNLADIYSTVEYFQTYREANQ